MLEPWAEVKVPGLEDQDKPWNKVTVWPGGGGGRDGKPFFALGKWKFWPIPLWLV